MLSAISFSVGQEYVGLVLLIVLEKAKKSEPYLIGEYGCETRGLSGVNGRVSCVRKARMFRAAL